MDEGIDYTFNHQDETVALAMEAVIQTGILWEDGIRETSPLIRVCLENAIGILQEYNLKTSQIGALIKTGKYYLDNMAVDGQDHTPEHQNSN